jgi:hypothetical protein
MGIWEDYCIGRLVDWQDTKVNAANKTAIRKDFKIVSILKADDAKTPNDFGFNKRSFSIVFHENELKKLQRNNIEKDIIRVDEKQIIVSLEKEHTETIDLFVVSEEEKKVKEKVSIDSEIKKVNDNGKEKLSAEEEKKSHKTITNGRNGEYFEAKLLAASSEYGTHTDAYKTFMNAYLYGSTDKNGRSVSETSDWSNKKNKGDIPSDELISYKEKTDYIQAIMMNELMHAPMNHADPRVKDRYEAWKLSSKFYQQLSFFYRDNILSPS